MSLKLHNSTSLGIEIEICIKKDFYKSLQNPANYDLYTQVYKYPEEEPDPFREIPKEESENTSPDATGQKKRTKKKNKSGSRTNSESGSSTNSESGSTTNSESGSYSNSESESVRSLKDIVLTHDLTCICPDETYTNAEVNSPRMGKTHVKYFMKFLEEVLFVDRSKFFQGKTCGIHIHWSNHRLQKFKNMPEYNFEFIKVMFFLKKYISHKVIHKDFSGRQHFYDKLDNEMEINLITQNRLEEDEDKIDILKKIKINLRGDTSFSDIKTLIENEQIEYFGWLDELDSNEKKILRFIDTLSPSEYSDLIMIHLFLIHKYKQPTIYNRKYGLKKVEGLVKDIEDLDINNLVSFFAEKREELVRDPEVRKSLEKTLVIMIETFGKPDIWNKNRFCKNFRKLITDPFKQGLKESGYLLNKEHEEEFFRLLYFINVLKNVLMGNSNLNMVKYRTLWERIMSVTLRPMGEVDDKYIIDRMVNNFKKQPISLYDMDQFHMELRVFSLDDLFSRLGDTVTGHDITTELTKFINMTNTMMMNIIDRFNKFFDERERGIPESRKQTYMEFFLMDKEYRPGNKVVKKRFNQLMGIERPKSKSLLPSLSMPKFSRRSRKVGPGKIKRKKTKRKGKKN